MSVRPTAKHEKTEDENENEDEGEGCRLTPTTYFLLSTIYFLVLPQVPP